MSAEHITVVTNAADIIDWFDKAGKRYPYPGLPVDRDDVLEVLESFLERRETARILGWCGIHDDILLRIEEVSREQNSMKLIDMGETAFSGVYSIADEPHPKAAEFHGDLVYELRPYEPSTDRAQRILDIYRKRR